MMITCLPVARIAWASGHRIARDAVVLLRQKIHGEMDALQFAPGDFRSRGCSAPMARTTA